MRMPINGKVNFFFILFLLILFFSCKEDFQSYDDYLSRGQDLVDTDPKKALITLDSINNPVEMDEDSYMQYIVTYVQAKYMTDQDITKDTLIFAAQRYFEKKGDAKFTALAYFYSASIYLEKEISDKALEYYTQSKEYSIKASQNILAGKCFNNIGYIYFEQDVMDSAIVYYQKALNFYEKESGMDYVKLIILTNLGRSYDDIEDFENARTYYGKALELAEQSNNQPYQAISYYNLGGVLRATGNYNQARDYLHKALSLTTSSDDSIRSYIYMSRLFVEANRIDSAEYYKKVVISKLGGVSDYKVLRYFYRALSEYSKQIGDFKEALRYSELERKVDQKITERNKAQKLFETNTRIYMERKQKEIDQAERKSYIYLLGVLLVVVLVIVFTVMMIRAMRRNYLESLEEIDTMKIQFRQQMENLLLLQNTYLDTVLNMVEADKEARLLDRGNENRAEIYEKTRKMVKDAKQKNRDQLVVWAKDYLKMQSFMNKVSLRLTDDDCLLLALCGYRYNGKEIAVIMGIPQDIMYLRKLELRNLFEIGGLNDDEIDDILYLEDKTISW